MNLDFIFRIIYLIYRSMKYLFEEKSNYFIWVEVTLTNIIIFQTSIKNIIFISNNHVKNIYKVFYKSIFFHG